MMLILLLLLLLVVALSILKMLPHRMLTSRMIRHPCFVGLFNLPCCHEDPHRSVSSSGRVKVLPEDPHRVFCYPARPREHPDLNFIGFAALEPERGAQKRPRLWRHA